MHSVEDMLVEKNYSKCPLKKRPVNYQFEDPEPQDLCVKKVEITEEEEEHPSEELINVSDCCEDEGVDVDHTDEEEMEEDEEDEDVDVDVDSDANQTQAAALAAAAAVAAVASAASVSASVTASVSGSVIMPTPTYPKYPWSFHMSPYTAEFYRTINHQATGHQISPCAAISWRPARPVTPWAPCRRRHITICMAGPAPSRRPCGPRSSTGQSEYGSISTSIASCRILPCPAIPLWAAITTTRPSRRPTPRTRTTPCAP